MSDASSNQKSKIGNQKFIEVSAGLVFRNGKLLITQRHADSHLGGLWEFPGGKREASETFEECLVRELREELGIEVEVGEVLESLTHAYPEKTVVLKFFCCRWKANEPQAIDCGDLRWVSAEELRNYEFPAADARLLEMLRTSPQLWKSET
ncbi:MAG TPA: 8-oxo-dGTP diphosphatase MutT [Candidatus Polarisedimenticolia bacterium]|nr:8-oxo-dGTP diphosphatase MutT [Candidatus Polarisedimenticolia bacterium]